MPLNLDDVDRKILKELQSDGRASFRDISARIGVSTPTVSARVQAMTDIGLISGYTTTLDADMLGQTSVVVRLDVRPADIEKVVERIKEDEIVRQVYVLSDSGAYSPSVRSTTRPSTGSSSTHWPRSRGREDPARRW